MKAFWIVAIGLLSGCELIVGFDPPPESGAQCSDGLDNDQNGLIDCRDPGCASAPGCMIGPDAAVLPDAGPMPDGPPGAPDAGAPDSGVTPAVCGNGIVDPPRPALGTPSPVDVAGPTRVATGDFNSDGIMDLAVLTTGVTSSSVTVLFGDGNTFTASGPPTVLDTVAKAIAVGDASGDGVPDIVVVGEGLLTRLDNDGSGDFPMLLGTDLGPGDDTGVALVDFDGDGTLDVAVTNTTDVLVFRKSEGVFQLLTDMPLTDGTVRVAGGDLDGDGNADLIVTQAPGQVATIAGFRFEFGSPSLITVGAGADALALGDLDGDGKPDIVVASTVAGEVAVILGGKPTSIDVGGTPTDVAILDLDGDGDKDIAVTIAGGKIVFLINDGSGIFTLSTVSVTLGGDGSAIVPLYVDGDTLPDVAVAEPNANRVEILRGAGQTEECDGSPGCSQFCAIAGGTPIWGKALGGPGADIATDVTTDPAGNVYVVGIFNGTATLGGGAPVTSAGQDDIFVASFTSDGTFRWRATFGGTFEDSVNAVAYDTIAKQLVIGGVGGPTTFGETTILAQHAYIALLDPATGAAISARDPLGPNAQGSVLTVAVDTHGRTFVGGGFQGTVNQDGGSFSGDGGYWTVIEGGAQGFIQSFTSNDTDAVVRIVTDEQGPILLIAFAGTIRELDVATEFSAVLVARYTPGGSLEWRQVFQSDADPGVIPADLVVDPLGQAVAFGQFSGTITVGEDQTTATDASDGILLAVTTGNTRVRTFDVGDSANGLGTDERGDFFLAGSLGLLSRQFDLTTGRWTVSPNGLRARRFAFGPHGEMYIAGRLVAATPVGSGTLTPSGDSDGLVARIHP